MWKNIDDMDPVQMLEMRSNGLVYWRALPSHPSWRICPRIRTGTTVTHEDITVPQVAYALNMLHGRLEHAIYLEE